MKPLLLASLPSSGSDWFASCICKAEPSLRYCREFFNATVNWQYARQLEPTLGDLMYATVPNLCRNLSQADVDQVLINTWDKEEYTFTKDNYLAFHLEQFSKHFRVMVLVRSFAETFPPNRHRVTRWYEHLWGSLVANNRITRSLNLPVERAAIGHYWFVRQMIDTAAKLNMPTFWFNDLMDKSGSELDRYLSPANMPTLAQHVAQTRHRTPRPSAREYFLQWQAGYEMYRNLESQHGEVYAC